MTSRRRLLSTFALLFGSGAVASTALTNTTTAPGADLRILADARPRNVVLRPGRDDEAYVIAEDDGEGGRHVTELVVGAAGDRGVSRSAETRFERLVEIHNEPGGPPIDELYFTFEVTDEGLEPEDPSPAVIADTLSIVSASGDVPGTGDQNYLEATDEGPPSGQLTPNSSIPFGLGVDLLGHGVTDLPDPERFDVMLVIESGQQGGGGGGPGGNNPGGGN